MKNTSNYNKIVLKYAILFIFLAYTYIGCIGIFVSTLFLNVIGFTDFSYFKLLLWLVYPIIYHFGLRKLFNKKLKDFGNSKVVTDKLLNLNKEEKEKFQNNLSKL